jgi:DNA recombination protein RmuC
MSIRMPNGRLVLVDSKAPMEAFLSALETDDEQEQRRRLEDHARHVRTHLRQLGAKDYTKAVEGTVDFVVLFLPNEALFSEALRVDSRLIEDGFRDRVLLATPTTMLALLRSVAYGWHQRTLSEEAEKTLKACEELFDRAVKVAELLEKMGKHLGQTVDSYNKVVGSYQSRLLVSGRKVESVLQNRKGLPELSDVESHVRALDPGSDANGSSREPDPSARNSGGDAPEDADRDDPPATDDPGAAPSGDAER